MAAMTTPLPPPTSAVLRVAFVTVAALMLLPQINAGISLLVGVIFALTLGNPFSTHMRRLTQKMLAISVVGLGAGMNLLTVARVGLSGIGYTIFTIAGTIALGYALGRLFKVPETITLLVSVGTAICGGSAIAAIAPVLQAEEHDISVALGIVFMLNALALLVFPPLGHALGLSALQFGLWGGLAIHDTSSVVGATLQFGRNAVEMATTVETGTTVKLARALWIVPLTVLFSLWQQRRRGGAATQKPKRPWFILGFVLAAAVATYGPAYVSQVSVWAKGVEFVAKRVLVLTLFFIGASLTRRTLAAVGLRPFVLGVALWLLVSTLTLGGINAGLIHL